MGCDGGTIPKRGELVRTKKNPEKKDKASDLSFKWGHCAITQEPLQRPIVACQLGRLYNKTSVIEAILDRAKLPDLHKHIKSLKDVKELNLTDNREYHKALESKDTSRVMNISPYICPLIGLEMNGKYRFVYIWSCGCVLSERALKFTKDSNCYKCQKPFSQEDVIVLNGTDEDKVVLEKRMLERQNKMKAEKSLKKESKSNAATAVTATTTTTPTTAATNTATPTADAEGTSSNSTPGAGVEKANETSKKPTNNLQQSGTHSKLPVKRPHKDGIKDPDFKKTRAEYSVAKDPKATEVYKSLFTSHKSADRQMKAHWITYNPFYN